MIVKAPLATPAPSETIEARLNAIEGAKHVACSRAFLLPKVSLGTLTAVLGWVFLFPRTFADHPFIGEMLKSRHAGVAWLGAVFCLAVASLRVWWLERRKEREVAELLSLTYQKAALDMTGRINPEGFSASDFQEQLFPKYVSYPNWLRRLSSVLPGKQLSYHPRPNYDAPMAEKVTELALERFIQKGWIARMERPDGKTSIDDWYRVV